MKDFVHFSTDSVQILAVFGYIRIDNQNNITFLKIFMVSETRF